MNSTKTSVIQEVAPNYWGQACTELMKQDRIMKKIIPKFGSGFLITRGDAFTTLARAIVGQQISVASAGRSGRLSKRAPITFTWM